MGKIIVFRGRITSTGREGRYPHIYVYMDFGGKELKSYIGKEVQGLLVIEDEGS